MRQALLFLSAVALAQASGWRSDFPVDANNLGVSGGNPYFVLTPGHIQHFAEGAARRTIRVLSHTLVIDGVECRIVLYRREKAGVPLAVAHRYFAIDRSNGDIYHFGEDVDLYRDGKVASHKGSWRSGVRDARFGLMMPGKIHIGDRFLQERAPKQGALERSEVIAKAEKVVTPAGVFECVHMRDSSPVEKGRRDKWYAPGVGLVKDGKAVLVKQGR